MIKSCPICNKQINVSELSGNICCSRACATVRFKRLRVAAKARAESVPRTCSKCGKTKPISEFFADSQKATGYRPDCKKCNQSRANEWGRKNKQKHYYYQIKTVYGLSQDQYLQMLNAQDYSCAICGCKQAGETDSSMNGSRKKSRLHIDHCHASGKVRGLLCFKCNTGIGRFGDDPIMLLKAVEYLNKYEISPDI